MTLSLRKSSIIILNTINLQCDKAISVKGDRYSFRTKLLQMGTSLDFLEIFEKNEN